MDDRIRELNRTVVEVEAPEYVYPDENFQGKRAEIQPVDEAAEIQISKEELIERYAKIQNISIEEAEEQVGAPTEEEILKRIENKTLEKIRSTQLPMNRAQRRALKKKLGSKAYAEAVANSGDITAAVTETAAKLNYIDLIQKLRKLNEEKEKNGNL
jgi:hypothetical protein